jgi:HAD superfamily hydrolase (TIGR01509 family)
MIESHAFLNESLGYIFDVDGTLLDSHDGHYHAWDRTARNHGFEYTEDEIIRHFGKTTQQIAIELMHLEDPSEIAEASEEKDNYFLEEIPTLALFDGVHEVFEKLKEKGVCVCLASSNHNAVLEQIMDSFDLRALVDAYVGLSDITRGKPDPEMIFLSAERLGLDPGACVMVGDTPYDIQAGQSAGCYTVGVATGSFSEEQLQEYGPSLVIARVGVLLDFI